MAPGMGSQFSNRAHGKRYCFVFPEIYSKFHIYHIKIDDELSVAASTWMMMLVKDLKVIIGLGSVGMYAHMPLCMYLFCWYVRMSNWMKPYTTPTSREVYRPFPNHPDRSHHDGNSL